MSQRQRIKDFLESGGVLTRLDSWSALGIIEAPARISELRREGMLIKTKMVTVINRYNERVSIAEWSL